MNRYFSSFVLTSLLYGSFFIFFGYLLSNSVKIEQKVVDEVKKISFCIIKPKPVEVNSHEIKIEPKPEPKPIIKPKPKLAPKPKPIPIPKIEPKPKPVLVEKKEPKVEEKVEVVEVVEKKKPIEPIESKKVIEEDTTIQKQLAIKKQKMLEDIRALIEKNKSYPRFARKANIEGIVKISFVISPKGELVSFTILEGKKIFHNSIEEALKNSFPYPAEKDVLNSNLTINLDVVYKLI